MASRWQHCRVQLSRHVARTECFGEGNDFLQWAIFKEKKESARKQELILPAKVGKDQKKTGLHLKIELIFHSKVGVDQKKGLRGVKTWFLS